MTTILTENGSKFFSRFDQDSSLFPLDNRLLSKLCPQDVVVISGSPGSGKTELLYHWIAKCILPASPCNGLDQRVILFDNDLRFDLFRFVKILERKLRYSQATSGISTNASKNSLFIDERLKLLDIFNCSDFDEFVCSLRYLEVTRPKKYVLMVDGITSFYWSTKMRNPFGSSMTQDCVSVMTALLRNVSRSCGMPVLLTRRKLDSSSGNGRTKLPVAWRNLVTKQLQLVCNGITEKSTDVIVEDVASGVKFQCGITSSGWKINIPNAANS
ncbi:DNA repair protein XRCC2 [Caerostris darwini]|uniref:DNA repair protein XRCC2 n=1 Tax=Caerostris darwini TaxID=1538125 RepID=A0AAV4W437_9ARAC|nr:DNA repair protein XRCC2 [Caerostris darwini]